MDELLREGAAPTYNTQDIDRAIDTEISQHMFGDPGKA